MPSPTMAEAQRAAYEAEQEARVVASMAARLDKCVTINAGQRCYEVRGLETFRFIAADGTIFEVELSEANSSRPKLQDANCLSVRTGMAGVNRGKHVLSVVPSAANQIYVTSG